MAEQSNGASEQVELLRAIWNEMKALNGRVNSTNERLEQTNARLEQTNARLEQTNARLERMDERLERLDERLEQLSQEFAGLSREMHEGFARIDARFDRFLVGPHRDDHADLHEQVDRLNARVVRLEERAGLGPPRT